MSGILSNTRKQLESCIFIMLLITLIGIEQTECRNIRRISYEKILVPKMIDQCRAACLDRFLFDRTNDVMQTNCLDHNNCAMCWDFCELLVVSETNVFRSICSNHTCVSI